MATYILCTRTSEAGDVLLSCKLALAMIGSKVVTMAGKPGTAPVPMIPERVAATSLPEVGIQATQGLWFWTYCMTSEYVMLSSSFVGETVVEPALTAVAARLLAVWLNADSRVAICCPIVVSLKVWFACSVTIRN